MPRADPHCHTTASDGMVSAAELVSDAAASGLDLIAVTDHDTMAAAAEAAARGEEIGLGVIKGEEITTAWPRLTHVVGLFLDKPVRSGMSLLDTCKAIQDQGGLIVIPHPFQSTPFASCQPQALQHLIETVSVDGIETLFTGALDERRRSELESFVSSHPDRVRCRIGASDSHFGRFDLARVVTEYPGGGPAGFRAAMAAGQTTPARLGERQVPASLVRRQKVKSTLQLPMRRLTGRLR